MKAAKLLNLLIGRFGSIFSFIFGFLILSLLNTATVTNGKPIMSWEIILMLSSMMVIIMWLVSWSTNIVDKGWRLFNSICAIIFVLFSVYLAKDIRNSKVNLSPYTDKYSQTITKDSTVIIETEYSILYFKPDSITDTTSTQLYNAYKLDIFKDTIDIGCVIKYNGKVMPYKFSRK